MLASLAVLLLFRLLRMPMTGYGDNGAEYNEHATRLGWLLHLRSRQLSDEVPSLFELMRQLESGFPPGLYILGNLVRPIAGYEAEQVGPVVGVLSVVTLLVSVGLIAWSVSRRAPVVRAAVLGVALLPAIHGAGLRYYFDLPMTAAAWASAAVLLWGGGRWPVRAGVLAALLAVTSSLLKWTALPFLLPMVVAQCFELTVADRNSRAEKRGPLHRRRLALVVMLLLWGLGVMGYLSIIGTPNSLVAMAAESSVAELDLEEGERETAVGGVLGLATSTLGHLVDPGYDRLLLQRGAFYSCGLVFAVFSPLLASVALLCLVLWWRRVRTGWPLLLGTIVGQLGFLMLLVRPADERFLLTLAPALVLLAALGWDSLTGPWRRRIAVGVLGLGLLVALDFHHLPSTVLTASHEVRLHSETERFPETPLGPLTLRGLGAASSVEQRGWARADEVTPRRLALREVVAGWFLSCRPRAVAAESGRPLISPRGDHVWLEYLDSLARARGSLRDSVAVAAVDCSSPANLAEGTVLMTLEPGDSTSGLDVMPPCLNSADWVALETLSDPDRGMGVQLWVRDPSYRCPGD